MVAVAQSRAGVVRNRTPLAWDAVGEAARPGRDAAGGRARRPPRAAGGRAGGALLGAAAEVSACWWSFRRLCVAVMSRHSERQAALPRRWKRSIRRLNLVWAKTGS